MNARGSRYTRLFSKRTEIKAKAWITKYMKWKITDCSKIDIKKRSSFNPRVHTESKKKVAALKKKNDTKSGGICTAIVTRSMCPMLRKRMQWQRLTPT